ncbi:MAG: galactose mutarotase [Bacteroidetes bacterium]|nr:MAG: galactose mutarotase [Bacteroidota bacterium]
MSLIIKIFFGFLGLVVIIGLTQCKTEKSVDSGETTPTEPGVSFEKSAYGTTQEGEPVDMYSLKNAQGMQVDVITYGGIITSWTAPDKNGAYENVVLGYDSLSQYIAGNPYFGALIGRFGNRIAKGKFSIDGTEYSLATNDGPNHLHGGVKGYDKVIWTAAEPVVDSNAVSLKLSYLSKDMEEGYPGNLKIDVTYTLNADNSLDVLYEATTDKATIVNLTQHSYFNLTGDFTKTILDHEIVLNADHFLPVDATLIPTGELMDVAGTPFDFRLPKTIGKEIVAEHDQLTKGLGYDHCWVLNSQDVGDRLVASAYDPGSGRFLEIWSDEPAIQFYSGNFLDGTLPMKGGEGTYAHRTGFCLETQHYPDSPNQPDFPPVRLDPGDKYVSYTSFKFSTK